MSDTDIDSAALNGAVEVKSHGLAVYTEARARLGCRQGGRSCDTGRKGTVDVREQEGAVHVWLHVWHARRPGAPCLHCHEQRAPVASRSLTEDRRSLWQQRTEERHLAGVRLV